MGEEDIGALPEVVPEDLTKEELREMKQEHTAEEAREKEATGEEELPGKTQSRV